MELGTFSVSLSVKDLATSRAFYEKLGFTVFHDASQQGYLILQNESSTLGLFQGMFEGNILTYKPGWDRSAQVVSPSTTCATSSERWIRRALRSAVQWLRDRRGLPVSRFTTPTGTSS